MESISINAIIITINRMWNEERDLRPFYSKVPKRKQILSVRNMKKKMSRVQETYFRNSKA